MAASPCTSSIGAIGPLRAVHTAAAPATAQLALTAGPNPTRGALRFALTLGEAAAARLDVFDVTGRRVATPQQGMLAAGTHTLDWEPSNTDGNRLATGVYFARFEALGRTTLVRLTVLDR